MENSPLPPVITNQVPTPMPVPAAPTPALTPDQPTTTTPPSSPLKKIIFLILTILVIGIMLIIALLIFNYSTTPNQQIGNQTLTVGSSADYQTARTQVLNANVATLGYQGQIANITDRLTIAYITNTLKSATFSPLQGSVRLPQDSDITLNFSGNRLVFVTDANRHQGERAGAIQESYLLYNNNLLGEQVVLPADFAQFIFDLLEKSFGADILPAQTSAQQQATNTAIIRGQLTPDGGITQITNYLELVRLRSINLDGSWSSELLVNEQSVLASAAPSNRKVILQLFHQTVVGDQRVLLEYAPYNWMGRSTIGFPYNYAASDYASVSGSLETGEDMITVAGVKGRMTFQSLTDYDGDSHPTITVYFPFYHYYLVLTYDLGKTETFPADQLVQLQAGNLPSTLTTGVTNFDALANSLIFLDRQ